MPDLRWFSDNLPRRSYGVCRLAKIRIKLTMLFRNFEMLVRDAARRPASGDGSFADRPKGSEVCHVRPQLCNRHGGAGFRSFAVWSASNPQVEAHSTGRSDGLRNISTARLATPARLVALAPRPIFRHCAELIVASILLDESGMPGTHPATAFVSTARCIRRRSVKPNLR